MINKLLLEFPVTADVNSSFIRNWVEFLSRVNENHFHTNGSAQEPIVLVSPVAAYLFLSLVFIRNTSTRITMCWFFPLACSVSENQNLVFLYLKWLTFFKISSTRQFPCQSNCAQHQLERRTRELGLHWRASAYTWASARLHTVHPRGRRKWCISRWRKGVYAWEKSGEQYERWRTENIQALQHFHRSSNRQGRRSYKRVSNC